MTLDDLGDRLFADVPEVASILGRDERTVRRAAVAGGIPATKVGNKWMVRTSWLREQAGQPSASIAPLPDLAELARHVAPLVVDELFARLARLATSPAAEQPNEAV